MTLTLFKGLVGLIEMSMNQFGTPSSSEKDTIEVQWHSDANLEAILGWHVWAYLRTMLGCYGDIL
jgi:hypothetical protein